MDYFKVKNNIHNCFITTRIEEIGPHLSDVDHVKMLAEVSTKIKELDQILNKYNDIASIKVGGPIGKLNYPERFSECHKSIKRDILKELQDEDELIQKRYLSIPETQLPIETPKTIWIVDFLKLINSVKTSSEAKRLIEDGAIEIDSKKITDFKQHITWNSCLTVRVGKHRIYRIK